MTLFSSLSIVTLLCRVLPAVGWCLPGIVLAVEPTVKPVIPTVEPGLEQAVKWSWKVEPADAAAWGIPIEVPVAAPPSTTLETPSTPQAAPAIPAKSKPVTKGPPDVAMEHVVAKGESLTAIARAHGVTVDQLRSFNAFKNDRLVIGQVVKVPGVNDITAMITAPAVTPVESQTKDAAKAKPVKAPAALPQQPPVLIATKPRRALPPAAWEASPMVLIQVFLDRQGFTIGPIDGTAGPVYDAAYKTFETARPGQLHTPEGTPSAAMLAIGGAYAEYVLNAADLRWISPRGIATWSKSKDKNGDTPPTLDELTHETFLAYRTGWEFVAERFHAAESFLRRLNPGIKNPNVPGTAFLVPNVLPFEIEQALAEPLQPAADPSAIVTASVVGLNRLVIRRGDAVIACMPVAAARPGLRGRNTWKILEAISRPSLTSTGDAAAPLPAPLKLPAGPNNPTGIVWINLAKSSDPKPLPYGLHGTSIPGLMTRQESIGGFRLTNWDIARAVRLLPVGTELKWE